MFGEGGLIGLIRKKRSQLCSPAGKTVHRDRIIVLEKQG
ncbi:hypothetical protein AMC99_01832 [Altererythrobacter epoxidivorans]|uniref:Uncharacterized protein n=1 Tax=Altererythrobacter epoxidivorans TaxID=361183 RepID=A0A0M4MUF3_9SPHN|nr:hypothetical protein AMC99_01832 [Altererythrobacter epoxidivorans]